MFRAFRVLGFFKIMPQKPPKGLSSPYFGGRRGVGLPPVGLPRRYSLMRAQDICPKHRTFALGSPTLQTLNPEP